MPYNPDRSRVQHIIVEENCRGQQMIGNWYLVYESPIAAAPGDSASLIASFRTAYRTHILVNRHSSVRVVRYTMIEVSGSSLFTPPAGSCKKLRYITNYDPSKKEVLEGDAVLDVGAVAPLNELPLHTCIRILKKAVVLRRGFFEGSYHRLSPLSEADHSDTVPEEWTEAALTAYTTMFGSMNTATYSDAGPLPNRWYPAIWSAGYHWTVVTPGGAGGMVANAATRLSYQVMRTVGTQVTRRYTPTGFLEGK